MIVNPSKQTGRVCLLALVVSVLVSHAYGQVGSPNRTANTVSVRSLAVPVKAREHLERARRASLKGNEDEYQRELAAALTLYPRYAEAYLLRATHELLLERYHAAIDAALTAQHLEPSIHWATIVHTIACNQLRHFEEASTLLDGLGAEEMRSWQAIFEKTRAAVGTGDTEGALEWSGRALSAVPEPRLDDTVLLRGDALLMAHRWKEAASEFERYLRSPRPQKHRAEVLALLERIPELASQDATELIAGGPL